MEIQDTYSAVLHRIDQAVRWRAVHPNEPVPPPFDILVKYSNPPEELIKKAKRRLEKLVVAADVKKGTGRASISARLVKMANDFLQYHLKSTPENELVQKQPPFQGSTSTLFLALREKPQRPLIQRTLSRPSKSFSTVPRAQTAFANPLKVLAKLSRSMFRTHLVTIYTGRRSRN